MKITYLFHSCFIVELQQYILIFDYYKGMLPDFDPAKKIIFLVSHFHGDHFTNKIFDYQNRYPDVSYIIDEAIKLPDYVDGIQVQAHQNYLFHDIAIYMLTSTDAGVAFLLNIEGKTIYHAGDLNWWHWTGEPSSDNKWQYQVFHKEIEFLRNKPIDAAFLPLDPRLEQSAWWGFQDTLQLCDITYCFPMHFSSDIKKMQAYLTLDVLAPYIHKIIKIDHALQSFSFK